MKRYIFITAFLCLAFLAMSQTLSLEGFNQTRLQRQKTAMNILGTWAVGNIAAGAIMQGRSEGSGRYFHRMNIGWNAVNLAIAGLGYWGVMRTDPSALGAWESVESHYGFQKILLFNAGLDVGYMLGGAWMMERAKSTPPEKKPERLKGFGQSVVLQGAFLFLFDLGTYLWLSSSNGQIPELLGHVGPASQGIGFSLKW